MNESEKQVKAGLDGSRRWKATAYPRKCQTYEAKKFRTVHMTLLSIWT